MSYTKLRYIGGIGVKDGEAVYSVFAVIESAPTDPQVRPVRVAGPYTIIDSMTKEQAQHLQLQLNNMLGFGEGDPRKEVRDGDVVPAT